MAQADFDTSTVTDEPESRPGGIPLFVWVIGAAILAVPVGLFAPKESAGSTSRPSLRSSRPSSSEP